MYRWLSLGALVLSPIVAMSEGCSPTDEGNDLGAPGGDDGNGAGSGESEAGGAAAGGPASGGREGGGGTPSSGGEGGQGGLGGGGTGGLGHPCASGCPANFWDIDVNPLTGSCGCEYACARLSESVDAFDDAFVDANCDGGDGVVEACVYVSASLGDDTIGAGTRAAPVQSIARGQAVAEIAGVSDVCVSGETYNETVSEVAGITVHFGFDQLDPDFPFRRKASAVTVILP
jgi:hypothetical protein